MITLEMIHEGNWFLADRLSLKPGQERYVRTPMGILAHAYAYRSRNARCYGIFAGQQMVGLAMVHDMTEEPACYHLAQFMIDGREQGKGYGTRALAEILKECRREGKFPRVEVCVHRQDLAAIHLYEKAGFRDTGYLDPDTPDSLCMACPLQQELRFQDIVLRDMREADIDDDIRWNTVETKWALWDAPWEMETELPKFDPAAYREKMLANLSKPKEGARWSLEVDTAEGVHIGSVSSYLIDENYEWVRLSDVLPGQKVWHTLGIEINDSRFWGRGLGTQALAAYISYHLDNGFTELCLQTWSGNVRMIRTAEKLGFVVCHREIGFRQVRGSVYDGLIFRLDVRKFRGFLMETP